MNVNSTSSMQNMYGMQGMGQGKQGQGGMMKDIMQQIPQEDRDALREKMQSMSQSERADMISQVKELDTSSISVEELRTSLLDIISPQDEDTTKNEDSLLDLYV